jgi:hypothetical protein
MTGGRGYLDELLKHEDDPLYWVNAKGGADSHDEGGGKIDGQHADGNGIENGHTAEQTSIKVPDHPAKPKPFATPSLSPAFPVSSRSPVPLESQAAMTRFLLSRWIQHHPWSALHLRPLF